MHKCHNAHVVYVYMDIPYVFSVRMILHSCIPVSVSWILDLSVVQALSYVSVCVPMDMCMRAMWIGALMCRNIYFRPLSAYCLVLAIVRFNSKMVLNV